MNYEHRLIYIVIINPQIFCIIRIAHDLTLHPNVKGI